MTAWVKKGTVEAVGVIVDYTDPKSVSSVTLLVIFLIHWSRLTEFNKKLIDEYLNIPYVETKCGYACSDQ